MASSDKRKGNPQVEDGYIRIATELYEQLYKIPLNGSQLRIVHFIIRNTYGYHRKEWKMSANYIANGIGINFRTVQRELNLLEKLNIISVKHCGSGSISIIGINKKYCEWNLQPTVNRPLRSTDRRGYGQSTVGGYGQSTVGSYGQLTAQHNIDKHTIENKEKKNKKVSLRSLGYPDDAVELLETVGAKIADNGKILTRFGTYVKPDEMDWEGLRD